MSLFYTIAHEVITTDATTNKRRFPWTHTGTVMHTIVRSRIWPLQQETARATRSNNLGLNKVGRYMFDCKRNSTSRFKKGSFLPKKVLLCKVIGETKETRNRKSRSAAPTRELLATRKRAVGWYWWKP